MNIKFINCYDNFKIGFICTLNMLQSRKIFAFASANAKILSKAQAAEKIKKLFWQVTTPTKFVFLRIDDRRFSFQL